MSSTSRIEVGTEAAVREAGQLLVEDGGREIAVFAVGSGFYAVSNYCVHQGGPMCDGEVRGALFEDADAGLVYGAEDRIVTCPWHGWEFDLETGQHLAKPDDYRLPTYEVTVEDGTVYIET